MNPMDHVVARNILSLTSLPFSLQKARFKAIESLQSATGRAIVVCTDVAARGLDIPNVATVVHYDVARGVNTFIHRAGRTAVSRCVIKRPIVTKMKEHFLGDESLNKSVWKLHVPLAV